MLPRKNKITRAEFDPLFKSGRAYRTPLFMMKISHIPNSPCKFSCVVAKKVSKISPNRHLLKRRVYSALAKYLPHLRPGTCGIIIMQPSTPPSSSPSSSSSLPSFQSLNDALRQVFEQSRSFLS